MKSMFRLFASLLCIVVMSSAALATDRYVCISSGNDLNSGTQAQPYKTLTKALSIRLPGDRVFLCGPGSYDLRPLENVPLAAYSGPVELVLPSGTVQLSSDFSIWMDLPTTPSTSLADVRIQLKAGGILKNVKWTYRRRNTSSDVLCTVNRDTKVEWTIE